jgi:hypothetical protein
MTKGRFRGPISQVQRACHRPVLHPATPKGSLTSPIREQPEDTDCARKNQVNRGLFRLLAVRCGEAECVRDREFDRSEIRVSKQGHHILAVCRLVAVEPV